MIHKRWRARRNALILTLATAAFTTLATASAQFPLPEPSLGFDTAPTANAALALARNSAPSANAGDGRTVVVGESVTLDGTGSSDIDGERLTYSWTLKAPRGSGARLSDPAAVRPTFTVDLLGDYSAELVVSDRKDNSEPATVRISTGNVAPVADAGINRRVSVGETVLLDAGASADFNGDTLTYRWSVRRAPPGSRAALANDRASMTGFTADRRGDYVLDLVASDGRLDSARASLWLSTADAHPHANAGIDRRVMAGTAVRLDGRESVDPDGSVLSHAWSLLHAPAGSGAKLDGAATSQPFLRTDAPGLYVAQLIVSDGRRSSRPETVVIDARAPATIGTLPPVGAAGSAHDSAALRGGGSDVDGDGVPDAIDNCVETPNADQIDTNSDGFGNRCDPDLDNDGLITNTIDLGLLKLAFFSQPGDANWNPDADFNGDGIVNVIELGILKFFFFNAPGPIANTFINAAGGDWHDPANWSLGGVPNAAHAVRIDLAPGVAVEYSTGSSQISSIRTTSPLNITGGSLNITRNAQFNDTLTISGATLANANIQVPDVLPAPAIEIPEFSAVTFDGVTLGSDLNVQRGVNLTVTDDLILDGSTITMLSDNNFTSILFSGANGATSLLGGTGEVVFAGTATVDNRNRVLASGGGHNLTVGPGITIRTDVTGGVVQHNSANGTITIQGTIAANLAGRAISINGYPLIIEGTLQVSNDSKIQASFNSTGGTITSAATVTVNTGELELLGDFTNDANIAVTDGTLDLGNAVGDEWINTGTITLSNATAELGGSYTLASAGSITGTGTVVLNGVLDNTGLTLDIGTDLPGTVVLGNGGSIVGGAINGTPVTLLTFQSFTLDGVMLGANVNIDSGATLNVSNGLTLNGSTITMLSDNNFTQLTFNGTNGDTSIFGGTGEVVFAGTATVDNRNRVLASGGGHNLTVGPGITIRTDVTGGVVQHNSANGTITIQGTVMANLSGRAISINGYPLIIEGTLQVSNDSKIQASFNSTGGTITSAATVTVNTGELELLGDFTNDANIAVTDGTLDLGNAVGDEWINTGTITLSNATAELGGSYTLASAGSITGTGTVVLNGVLDNTGLTLDIGTDLPGTVVLGNGGSIVGGAINGTPVTLLTFQSFTLDGVMLGANVNIDSGATLNVSNGLTLNGSTITMLSDNNFTQLTFNGANGDTSIFGGTGEVVFAGTATVDNRNRVLASGGGHNLTVAPGITIRSNATGGEVRQNSSNGTITIQGTVTSNLSGRTVTIAGFPLSIEGTLNAAAGSTMALSNYTLAGSAVLNAEIGGVTTSDYGRFTGTTGNLNGTLNITLVNGFSPALGNTFGNLTFTTTRNGTFTSVNTPVLGGGLSWQTNYNPADVTLEIVN